MVDIVQQIAYWRDGARDEWKVALVRLAEVSGLEVSPQHADVLAETNEFVLAARYPDTTSPVPTPDDARKHRERALEVFEWLIKQL